MATLVRWILELLFRPKGRHRATAPAPEPLPVLQERPPLPWHAKFEIFDGDASPIVRPYLIAAEQRRETQQLTRQQTSRRANLLVRTGSYTPEEHRQRERRRALVLATMGIDYVPEVAA